MDVSMIRFVIYLTLNRNMNRYLAKGKIASLVLEFMEPVRDSVQFLTKHALLEQSDLSPQSLPWMPRLYWDRVFDVAVQVTFLAY